MLRLLVAKNTRLHQTIRRVVKDTPSFSDALVMFLICRMQFRCKVVQGSYVGEPGREGGRTCCLDSITLVWTGRTILRTSTNDAICRFRISTFGRIFAYGLLLSSALYKKLPELYFCQEMSFSFDYNQR